MSRTYLILDIETIPDHSIWSNPAPEEMSTIQECLSSIADAISQEASIEVTGAINKSLDQIPPYAQRPIVIGCVQLNEDLTLKKMGSIAAKKGDESPQDEKRILKSWNEYMEKSHAAIATWFGRGFDLPVLMLRSMRHGIAMPWYFDDNKNYRYRYKDNDHADLCEHMGDFGAVRGFKLDQAAKLIGLPGKFGPFGGGQVHEMWKKGKIEEIKTYCLTDVIQTAFLFQRWRYMKGKILIDDYRDAAVSLIEGCEKMPELADFVKLIDRKYLLIQNEEIQ